MKIAFFDTKPYDRPSFDKYGKEYGVDFKYFETKLNEDTADLAHGFDGVCVFVNDIVSAEYSEQEADLRLRGTPYVVWSNCDIDESWLPEYVSLHSLGSCVLASAGAARSDYDSYVAQLTRQVPVFLSGGDWYDAEGQRHDYQGMAQLPEALQDYVCLLYNNLAGGEGRLDEFFCGS